jgi:hypothetical protein
MLQLPLLVNGKAVDAFCFVPGLSGTAGRIKAHGRGPQAAKPTRALDRSLQSSGCGVFSGKWWLRGGSLLFRYIQAERLGYLHVEP